jgi:hypothetical protein
MDDDDDDVWSPVPHAAAKVENSTEAKAQNEFERVSDFAIGFMGAPHLNADDEVSRARRTSTARAMRRDAL